MNVLIWMMFFSYTLVTVDSIEPSCNPQYDILKTIVKLEQKLDKMEDIIKEQQKFINKLSKEGKWCSYLVYYTKILLCVELCTCIYIIRDRVVRFVDFESPSWVQIPPSIFDQEAIVLVYGMLVVQAAAITSDNTRMDT